MSRSTPSANRSKPPGSPPRAVFWLTAAGLHLLFLGWAVFFGPARQIVFERDKPKTEVLMRGRELEDVIDQVRLTVADQLRERVELLQAGQQRMANNFETLNTHYQPFESAQREVAAMRFDQYADVLLEGQAALLERVRASSEKEDFAAVAKAHEEQMPTLISALDEVRRGVMLLTKDEALAERNAEAEDAMYVADRALRSVGSNFYRIADRLESAERFREAALEHEQDVKRLTEELSVAREQLAKAEAELAEAKQAHAEATAAAEAGKVDGEVPKQLSRAVRDAGGQVRRAERGVNRAEHAVSSAQRHMKRDQHTAESNRERAAARQAEAEDHDTRMREEMTVAIEMLVKAATLHAEVVEAVREAAALTAPPEDEPTQAEGTT